MEVVSRDEGGSNVFRTTHWTIILGAAQPDGKGSQEAMALIYQDYWFPLYAYVRRRGYAPTDAEDLAQNFFVHLIEKRALHGLERNGGKFRSFLLRSMDNFLANEWDRAHAQKRGAGVQPLSLDVPAAESNYLLQPVSEDNPRTLFERQWVFALLANVLKRLGHECQVAGKGKLFTELLPFLEGEQRAKPYAEIAAQLGLTEGAVKVAVHRLRQRYAELLREEIGRTVDGPEEVDEEWRYLRAIVSSGRGGQL